MNNLIEITNNEGFDLNNSKTEFEAIYDHYTVTGSVECEIGYHELAEPELGLVDSPCLEEAYFWNIKVFADDCSNISLNKKEMISVKNDIENHFDKIIQSI